MNSESTLEETIKDQIRQWGRITFAEFMEMALYSPHGGYYLSSDRIGAEGDFYTSPSTHPAFGALVLLQLGQMWDLLGRASAFTVVEVGAGKGLLCQDILDYSRHLGEFHPSLNYVCIEKGGPTPSPKNGATGFSPNMEHLPPVIGCFLSNELLDCLPVHRVVRQGGRLQEVFVGLKGDRFIEVIDEPSTPLLEEQFQRVGVDLAEGCQAEVNLNVPAFMSTVARKLDRGFVITIDYGYPAAELYSPQRRRGTLLCYYRHTTNEDPYTRIGRQDITAHVDFTAVALFGQESGLETIDFVTQREFLMNLGINRFIEGLPRMGLGQQQELANRLSMLNLIKPGGFGDFRVLIQGKGVTEPRLAGLTGEGPWPGDLPVPVMSSRHVPLLPSMYPHYDFDWENIW